MRDANEGLRGNERAAGRGFARRRRCPLEGARGDQGLTPRARPADDIRTRYRKRGAERAGERGDRPLRPLRITRLMSEAFRAPWASSCRVSSGCCTARVGRAGRALVKLQFWDTRRRGFVKFHDFGLGSLRVVEGPISLGFARFRSAARRAATATRPGATRSGCAKTGRKTSRDTPECHG